MWVLQQRCFPCSRRGDGFASLPIDPWGHSRNGPVLWLLNWHPEKLLGGPRGLRPSALHDPCLAAYQENSLTLLASSEVAAERKHPAKCGLAVPTVGVSEKPCRDGYILGGYSQFVCMRSQRHRVQMKSMLLSACIQSHLEECISWTKQVVHIQMLSVSHGFICYVTVTGHWPPTSSAAVVAIAPVHGWKWTSPNTMPACLAGQEVVVSQLTSLSSTGPANWLSWPLPAWTHLLRTGGLFLLLNSTLFFTRIASPDSSFSLKGWCSASHTHPPI